MNTQNPENLVPQYTTTKCVNCFGYGAIGRTPRVICPACKGEGILKIPLVRLINVPEAEKKT